MKKKWVGLGLMLGLATGVWGGTVEIEMAGTNAVTLNWEAEEGLTYRVETTTDLNEPVVWSNATPEGLVFSNATGVCELPADGPRRFYRFAAGEPTTTGLYMVVNLSGGPEAESYPISYLEEVPEGGWTDEYKTTKLVMRRIPAGAFTMGSPEGELGRDSNEPQHQVALTKDFYIGVFEVTQKQWERVMGTWPSYFTNAAYRETRPVEMVSYFEIRENPLPETDVYSKGSAISPNWPQSNQVHADSFMGRLRAKTGLSTFDLPTEAQWEYACRAGTTTALNSGKNLTGTSTCTNVAEAGRYRYNGGSNDNPNGDTSVGSAKVGSYLPNAWGLYDMHGNVWEWCLDWYESTPAGALDPLGSASGSLRVPRGGSWINLARYCRSADRISNTPDYRNYSLGFRLSRTLP
ncbi:MAG: formylglycine-generating enzyme family protein [Kiritimatiellia bacterium]|jgi:formylglycine-generating enzyme required for sulfatase activity|nr:formylglycine-generating enzyme family protein [Kiritimatiellia bacterium]